MTAGTDALKQAFRDFQTDGIPATGLNEPIKPEIRAALDTLAIDIVAAGAGGDPDAVRAVIEPLRDDAVGAAGFDLRSDAISFAPKMATGEQTTVRATDTGTHAAVAGEVRLDGTAATAGELIPNEGRYTKQASGVLWRTASTERQLTAAQSTLAQTAASQVTTSSDINIWKDAYFRAVRGEPAASSFASLSLDGAVRAIAASTIMSWDDTASPFGNPAISVGANGSVDLYHYVADGMIRPGQSISARVGLIVPAGLTVQVQAFLRQGYAGTTVATGTAVSLTGDGNYTEVVLPALTNVANGTALDVRVSRSSGTGAHKICAIGAYIGTAARPMVEDVASKYYVRTALTLAQAATTQLALVLVPSKNLFDVSRPFSTSITSQNRENVYVIYSSGAIAANTSYNLTHYIEMDVNTSYARSFAHQAAFYSGPECTTAQYLSGIQTSDGLVFTTPTNGSNTKVYARFSVSKAAWAQFQVEKGTASTSWVAYGSVFNPAYLPDTSALTARVDKFLTQDGAPIITPYRPEFLRHCRYRLTKLSLPTPEPVLMGFVTPGDSWFHKPGRSTEAFTNKMVAKYGDGGMGFTSFGFLQSGNVAPWIVGNQPSFLNGNVRPSKYACRLYGNIVGTYYTGAGPDIAMATFSASGDAAEIDFPAGHPNTIAKLIYVPTAGAQMRYTINGGSSWTALDLSAGTAGVTTSMPINVPPAAGTLRIEWVAGTCPASGVFARGTSGVFVSKIAATGSRITQFSGAPATSWENGIAALEPNCFIYMDGTNSQSATIAASAWGDALQVLIGRARTAVPGIDVLIATPAENQRTTNTIPMTAYATEARKRALTLRFAYNDMQDVFGDPASPTEYGYTGAIPLMLSDLIHPDDATGGRSVASQLLNSVSPHKAA